MPNLYPTFNLPTIRANGEQAKKRTYKPSLYFDFDVGDFVLDQAHRPILAEGREAYCQWCLKQCITERNTRLAYSDKIGVEVIKAAREETDIKAVESSIQRTITEALMVNPATEYVKGFYFEWDGADSLRVTFTVKGHEWEETQLQVTY